MSIIIEELELPKIVSKLHRRAVKPIERSSTFANSSSELKHGWDGELVRWVKCGDGDERIELTLLHICQLLVRTETWVGWGWGYWPRKAVEHICQFLVRAVRWAVGKSMREILPKESKGTKAHFPSPRAGAKRYWHGYGTNINQCMSVPGHFIRVECCMVFVPKYSIRSFVNILLIVLRVAHVNPPGEPPKLPPDPH